MEFLLFVLCAFAGGVFGWFVSAQVLAMTTLIGLSFALVGIFIGSANPEKGNLYFILGGFCVLLFILGAWMTNTAL